MDNIFYEQIKTVKSSDIPLIIEDPIADLRKKYDHCSICNERFLIGNGSIRPMFAFINYACTVDDIEYKQIGSSAMGDKLYGMIKYLSSHFNLLNNIYITSIFGCVESKVENTIEKHIDIGMKKFQEEMEAVNPRNLILLGHKAASILGLDCSEFDKLRGIKHTIKLDKYYPAYVTYSLEELYLLNSKIRLLVRDDLDFVIKSSAHF